MSQMSSNPVTFFLCIPWLFFYNLKTSYYKKFQIYLQVKKLLLVQWIPITPITQIEQLGRFCSVCLAYYFLFFFFVKVFSSKLHILNHFFSTYFISISENYGHFLTLPICCNYNLQNFSVRNSYIFWFSYTVFWGLWNPEMICTTFVFIHFSGWGHLFTFKFLIAIALEVMNAQLWSCMCFPEALFSFLKPHKRV